MKNIYRADHFAVWRMLEPRQRTTRHPLYFFPRTFF